MPGSFADTNVLVYLASGDAQKAGRAESVLAAGCTISVQVLNEFTHVARRKMAFTWDEVRDFLGTVRAIAKVVPLTIETHDEGVQIADRYRLSVYDGNWCDQAVGQSQAHGAGVSFDSGNCVGHHRA